ncbi:hypothetical protein [Bosea sp. (in: a-proteobacteria)]|uniref:hypothetical protein n=1 Tax=Bosea sp. (in: a-proteobacteria) TaxID=1871050 RepID=UPI0025BCF8D7|nr:hypothetical protein [Bosea sp. (in: a-proteobacteria)]MBR3190444.1 hypothetical protein [Bosea sp. (in: a-proteobacteria)]
MTTDDYAALGRLEGAGHAKAMYQNCLGAEPAVVALFEVERLKLIVERMTALHADGASPDDLAAYGEAVNRRFAEAVAEIALDARLAAAASPEPSPPGNLKARLTARKGLH